MEYPSETMRLEYLLDKFNERLLLHIPIDNVTHAKPLREYCVSNLSVLLCHFAALPLPFEIPSAVSEQTARYSLKARTLTVEMCMQMNKDQYQYNSFDLDLCLNVALILSECWSFRDINRFLENIRTNVLGTERYVLICHFFSILTLLH